MENTKLTQKEVETFVKNNIGICQTMLVDHLLSEDIFSHDDIQNLYYIACPECGGEVSGDEEDKEKNICDNCETVYTNEEKDNLDTQAVEVLEWWTVDEWMKECFIRENEVVLSNDFGDWWGRTTSGQAIYMDSVINKIANE